MFFETFCKLCQSKGMSANGVAKELSIASGTVSEWKKGRVPQNATLLKVASYFGVTVDDLLGNTTDQKEKNAKDGKFSNGVNTKFIGRDGVVNLLGKETNPKSELIFLPDSNGYMIPLFESVSAGFGAYPDDNIIGYELCYIENKAEAAETICIKVSGDSMYPKIENGDVIQVHKQDSVDSGKIAVVLVDGEDALVKKVVYGSACIELHSFNPMYPVVRFDGKDVLRVRVLGQVRTIIKRV